METNKRNKIIIGVVIFIILCIIGVITGIIISQRDSSNDDKLKYIKEKDSSITLEKDKDKPWCYPTSYEFTQTASGVKSPSSTVSVKKSTTETFPKIQLGDIVSGSTINVIKTVMKTIPTVTTIEFSGGKVKKNGSDTNLYELTSGGLFIDYDNECVDIFVPIKPFFDTIIPLDPMNFSKTIPASNASVTYRVQFVSRNKTESAVDEKVYMPFSLVTGVDAFNKFPVFKIMSAYGKSGLRIQRKKLDGTFEMLKKEYEEPVSTVSLTDGGGMYFLFIDTQPIQIAQVKSVSATFKSFNNSFI
jgi:hypothetical protein